ncbi:hypothetical protein RRG08_044074 [Elysia crispata]|uniref:Uncharacterized protein n=1 Tax=Elysia crispata TaxID=231223 RepID=A0AAE1EG72_9GAST|nr:hypothetical protein RRG08_044074 [Elysia crispata]
MIITNCEARCEAYIRQGRDWRVDTCTLADNTRTKNHPHETEILITTRRRAYITHTHTQCPRRYTRGRQSKQLSIITAVDKGQTIKTSFLRENKGRPLTQRHLTTSNREATKALY